jgi:hypothetical protein
MKLIAVLLVAAAASQAQEPYSQLRADGPRTLAITYRCNPADRAKLRQRMLDNAIPRFEDWKTQGVLKDYRILFNQYVDSETFDMMSLLTFAKYSDVARWREIEKTMPGGLPQDAAVLVTSAVTASLDGIRQEHAAAPSPRGRSVFFLIPYDYLVPTDDYVRYLDTYVIPQVNGWLGEGVLSAYTIYLSRYSTGRAWSSLFLLEYRDAAALGLREATVAKVREKLKRDPAWLAASESKQKIRVEKQTVIAEELLPK